MITPPLWHAKATCGPLLLYEATGPALVVFAGLGDVLARVDADNADMLPAFWRQELRVEVSPR